MEDHGKEKPLVSDEQLKEFYLVSPKKFYDFLKKAGVTSLICPICRNKEIGVIPTISDKVPLTYQKPIEEESYITPHVMPSLGRVTSSCLKSPSPMDFFYPVICNTCGHTQWFQAWRVITWMQFDDVKDEDE